MCGIFGVVSQNLQRYPLERLRRYESVQRHRGPDDSGEYSDRHAYLGFNRLSIIDLSANGHQPMPDVSGRYRIVFNGEIYNFPALRKLVEEKVPLKSRTDSEVLLYLYIEHGTGVLQQLDGMFAFAIWDSHKKTLFLARDRFGEKPLWYKFTDDGIVFSSEIRTLIRTGLVERAIDKEGLYRYPWLGTPAFGKSIIEGVRGIQPAHYILYELGKKPEEKCYWRLTDRSSLAAVTRPDAVERVKELLTESVKNRLLSDVPLGLFYSGGIDSSVIAALVSRVHREELHSYSIGFDEKDYDETKEANSGAQYYGLKHHAFTISLKETFDHIPKFIKAMDFPIADGINTYFVSMFARQKLTVALSGVGGDELFGGYSTFRYLHLLKKLKVFSLSEKERTGKWFDRLSSEKQTNWKIRTLAYLAGGFATEGRQHELVRTFFRSIELQKIFSEEFLDHRKFPLPVTILDDRIRTHETNLFGRISLREMDSYLSSLLLPAIDTFSMAFSLEVRAPFLSHTLAEYMYGLPEKIKFHPGRQKGLLVEAFEKLLPPALVNRKKKGFGFPLERWIFLSPFRELVNDTLSSASLGSRGFFNRPFIERERKNVFKRKNGNAIPHQTFMRLWTLCVLELWLREHFDA